MGNYLCHCFLYSPDAIFEEVLIVAWARPRIPKVCACFVVHVSKLCLNFRLTRV